MEQSFVTIVTPPKEEESLRKFYASSTPFLVQHQRKYFSVNTTPQEEVAHFRTESIGLPEQAVKLANEIGYCAPDRQLNSHALVSPKFPITYKLSGRDFEDLSSYNDSLKSCVKFPAIACTPGYAHDCNQYVRHQRISDGGHVREAGASVAASIVRAVAQARRARQREV